MVEQQAVEPQTPIELKSAFTMDIMILQELDIIGKFIDNSAVKADAGNINSLQEWKSGLRQFYRNIKSFLTIQIQELCEKGFEEFDHLLDPIAGVMPTSKTDIQKTYKLAGFLTELLFNARNELFMRFIEIVNPRRKAAEYAFSALSESEKEEAIRKTLGESNGSKKR